MSEIPENMDELGSESNDQNKLNNDSKEFIHDFNSGIIRKTEYFDLFISYKRDNGDDHGQVIAEELHEKLTQDGYKVWLDNQEIGFSNNFEQRIEEALLHSKKILCIIGPGWVESPNCRFEVKKAIEFEKRIIPVHYQEFREILHAKQKEGELTLDEWNRIDKPQEVDFSSPERHRKGYEDIKALCALHDDITEQHNQFLCEAYYWKKYRSPKSMLLTGAAVAKAKLVRDKCESDGELPRFSPLQNEFLEASQNFVAQEVSNKRKVYLAYSQEEYKEAAELNMELKLHGISTWFEGEVNDSKDESHFVDAILKSENVLEVVSETSAPEDSVKIAFARSNNKRVIKVTSSVKILEEQKLNNEKNIYLWGGQIRIDELITTINGDAVYNSAHSKLLEEAYEWEKSDKNNSKLLALKEARIKKEWYKEAEKMGSEPQPNLSMVNFVERSVAYAETLKKRRIGLLWTAVLGVILIVILGVSAWKLQGTANEAIEDAKVASDLASQKQEEADQAQKDAEDAKAEAQESILKTQQAEKDAAQAEKEAKEAETAAQIAKSEAALAKEQAKLAQADAAVAKAEAEVAKAEAEVAKAEAADAIETLAETEKALEMAKVEADSISFITKGRIRALKAAEDLQSRDKVGATQNAKQSVAFLTDSVAASAQIQSLYDVFTELIPSDSPLNLDNNREDKTETELIKILMDSKEFEPNKFPTAFSSIAVNEISVQVASGSNKPSDNKIEHILNNVKLKDAVSAICISPDGERVAVGLKTGVVEMWNIEKGELIDEILNHSYRITSIAFSPSGKEVAIASIDEKFSIVKLTEKGERNPLTENVKKDNGSRIQKIYYWNENNIVTVSWKDYSKIWGTDVKYLSTKI